MSKYYNLEGVNEFERELVLDLEKLTDKELAALMAQFEIEFSTPQVDAEDMIDALLNDTELVELRRALSELQSA